MLNSNSVSAIHQMHINRYIPCTILLR